MSGRRIISAVLFICLAITHGICLAQDSAPFPEGQAFVDDPHADALERRLAELEGEVRYLRSTQSRSRHLDCTFANCTSPYFEAGSEVSFLAPHSTTGLGPSGIAFFPSDELFPSWRTWIGYTSAGGWGIRGRYWEFDHLVTNNRNVFTYGLDVYVADLEVTSRHVFDDWEVLFSGGVRHMDFHEDRTFVSTSFVDLDATGIVIGAELARDLVAGFRGFGIARTSMLFGDLTGEVPAGFVVTFDNKQTFTSEAQLGIEYFREVGMGEVSLRIGAEAQYWNEVTYKFDNTTRDPESIGLIGVFTGFMVRI